MAKKNIFLILILSISAINLYQSILHFNTISLLISILGIISGILLILSKKSSNIFIIIWILGQLVIISKDIYSTRNNAWYFKRIFDGCEAIQYNFGLQFELENEVFHIEFNLVAIALYLLYKVLIKKHN